jgi:hypothetical protein
MKSSVHYGRIYKSGGSSKFRYPRTVNFKPNHARLTNPFPANATISRYEGTSNAFLLFVAFEGIFTVALLLLYEKPA